MQWGIIHQQRLESLDELPDGTPDWRPLVPTGQFLRDDPAAPWNREPRVIGQIDGQPLLEAVDRNPESYPGLLWTPPRVVPLVKLPQPATAPGERAVAYLEWLPDRVERRWRIETVQAPAPTRRVWATGGHFWRAFTDAERVLMAGRPEAVVKKLIADLATWPGEVWSDDPQVQGAVGALVQMNVISAERATEILTPPGLL